ncbi:hypothetical protein [Labrenzia sp. PHM005]|uniref:hypothetical protein n=1 Tax=Labrenzia sp. PHM005 TaxID=2590016 RepID=UPI00113FF78A|nr:hypothetical protein [Labrenzia sp. PHM005]QDG76723.1 hypothetical protein FJ695_13040 [Labrenzia sp. PHM005]
MLESNDLFNRPSEFMFNGPTVRLSLTVQAFICENGSGQDKKNPKTDDRDTEEPDLPQTGPKEKTLTEAFDDLEAEEQETVKRLVDRMIGRKQ